MKFVKASSRRRMFAAHFGSDHGGPSGSCRRGAVARARGDSSEAAGPAPRLAATTRFFRRFPCFRPRPPLRVSPPRSPSPSATAAAVTIGARCAPVATDGAGVGSDSPGLRLRRLRRPPREVRRLSGATKAPAGAAAVAEWDTPSSASAAVEPRTIGSTSIVTAVEGGATTRLDLERGGGRLKSREALRRKKMLLSIIWFTNILHS